MKFEFNTKYYLIPSICTSLAIVSIMIYFYLKLDSDNYSIKFRLKYHTDAVSCLVALKNGDLASGSNDKSIIIWDLSKKEVNYKLVNHTSGITSLTQLTTGDLVSGSADGQIIKWKFDTKESRYFMELILREHDENIIWSLLSLDDGHKLASSDNDRTIRIWDLNEFKFKYLFSDGGIDGMKSLNNGLLGSGSYNLKIWDTNNGRLRHTFHEIQFMHYVYSMSWLAKYNYLVTGYQDGQIKVWDINRLRLRFLIRNAHYYSVDHLVALNDGNLLSVGDDKDFNVEIKLWNMRNGVLLKTIKSNIDIESICLLDNGYLVSGSRNGTIQIYSN